MNLRVPRQIDAPIFSILARFLAQIAQCVEAVMNCHTVTPITEQCSLM
jgi:hypothetical protein